MINFKKTSQHDLYNDSLAPVDYNKRTIGYFGSGAIWFGIAVQVSGFLVMTPLLNYHTIGELIWIYAIGEVLLLLSCFLVADIGLKHGITFATSINASFGPIGGKIAGLIRMLPSMIFFGVNGYLGSTALNQVLKLVFNFDNMWFAIILNATLLVLVTITGAKGIERFTSLAAPLLIVISVYLFYVLFDSYDVSFTSILDKGRLGGSSRNWLFAFGVIIGNCASVAMGWNDYTKDFKAPHGIGKSNNLHLLATLIGSVPAFVFCSILGCAVMVVVPGTTGGDILGTLTDLVAQRSTVLAIVISIFVWAAQLSTNTACNLLPSIYVICGLAPKRLNFKPACVLFAVCSIALQPWKLGTSLDAVLNIFGLTAGPVIAIVVVDYYYFRKRKLSLDDIYNSNGKYSYWKGMNPAAMIAYVIGTAIAYIFFDYSYFVSLIATSILYFCLAKYYGKKYPVIIEETADDVVFEGVA